MRYATTITTMYQNNSAAQLKNVEVIAKTKIRYCFGKRNKTNNII